MRNILRQALRNLSRIGIRLEDTDPPKGAGQRHGVSNAASSNMFESPVLRSAFEQARKARARSNAARARVGRSPGVVLRSRAPLRNVCKLQCLRFKCHVPRHTPTAAFPAPAPPTPPDTRTLYYPTYAISR